MEDENQIILYKLKIAIYCLVILIFLTIYGVFCSYKQNRFKIIEPSNKYATSHKI